MESPFAFWGSWAIGVLIAEHFLTGTHSPFARLRFDAVLVTALVLGAVKPLSGYAFFAFALATGIAMERLFSGTWAIPKNSFTRFLGTHLDVLGMVSYSFYLFHGPIVHAAGRLALAAFPGPPFAPMLRFIVTCGCYPVVLVMAYLLYRLVEVPSVKLGKRLMAG
jgi:peptidoglycan/LPS O-acetylase OafA/YrhL